MRPLLRDSDLAVLVRLAVQVTRPDLLAMVPLAFATEARRRHANLSASESTPDAGDAAAPPAAKASGVDSGAEAEAPVMVAVVDSGNARASAPDCKGETASS